MRTADFSFDLPKELIAQEPPAERGTSRLLLLDRRTQTRGHYRVTDLPELVPAGSVFVFNNSKVRKARLIGSAEDAERIAFLLIRRLDALTWETMVQRAKRRRIGSRYYFAGGVSAEITGEAGAYRLLRFDRPIDDAWLDRYGHIPLPPYIKRADTGADAERYQTVYADSCGSIAAPTAGLHFTQALLDTLRARGFKTAFVTLHVGVGTFLPVRTEQIEAHVMHEELFSISAETAHTIERAKAEGRRIIAVGTTSARTLESARQSGKLRPGDGIASLFIYPGYTFHAIDGLFTNFHTPESTLLMLVSAFSGKDFILESYQEAIRKQYRFFSYGDAMLIL